jgi:predicted amidohydrolase
MFDAFGYRESDWVTPGSGETLVFPFGDLLLGVATCYDVRFPEIFRHLADRGADVILLPAAWASGPLKESHWEVLVRARAIENTVYMAAAGLVGAGVTGSSMLVDPMGVPVVRLGETPGLIIGMVKRARLNEVREKLPSFEHIRPEVYARWQPVPR